MVYGPTPVSCPFLKSQLEFESTARIGNINFKTLENLKPNLLT